jgi:hypothetical protein
MLKSKKKSTVLKIGKTAHNTEANFWAPPELLQACVKLKKQKKGIDTYLRKQGLGSVAIRELKQVLQQGGPILPNNPSQAKKVKTDSEDASEWSSSLKFTEKYVYNKEDDKYVMWLRAANGNVVLKGDTVRGIKENYSNWYGNDHTINEVCRNYKIPRNYLVEILRVLGITHDSEPITDEQLKERDVSEVTNDILQKKKFQLYQEFQKQSWKDTEEAARKWQQLQEGVLDPFSNFLSNWQPPKYSPIKYTGPSQDKSKSKTMLVGLSDVHFGAKTNSKESYRGKGYSTTEAEEYITAYAKEIAKIVKDRNYGFDKCVLAALGDILHTTGAGFTTKGTMLVHDCIKEEQFTFAFNSIVYLIDTLLSLFGKVEVKSVKGNHNDFGDWVLFKALEAYYRSEKRICFEVFQSDHGLFKIQNTLFIASHGYSAEYKGRLPSSGKARESYVANLFLSKPEALIGVRQKVLLTADQHHLEMKEYAEFEHYMLSTTVRGDKHSEAMGLNNISRQSCFILDEVGIKEIAYCYGR